MSEWYDPPEGIVSRLGGRAQGWLIRKPWPLWRIGNLISDLRYWSWKRNGGTHGC